VYRLRKLEERPRANRRAVEPLIIIIIIIIIIIMLYGEIEWEGVD
jgi:hypothetical protein